MSAVSMFFYFRLVMAMYLQGREGERSWPAAGRCKFVAAICLIVTLLIGILPSRFIEQAGRSGVPVSRRIADAGR